MDKRLILYLKGVKHLKLTLRAQTVKAPFQRCQLFGFADASRADDKNLRAAARCAKFCAANSVLRFPREGLLVETGSCFYPRSLDERG